MKRIFELVPFGELGEKLDPNFADRTLREEIPLFLSQPHHDFYSCTSAKERAEYWKLAVREMRSERYGLDSLSKLSPQIRDFHRHTVLLARNRETRQLAGAMRLLTPYDISQFTNLYRDFTRSLSPADVACVSVYYSENISIKNRLIVWHSLLSLMTKHCSKAGIKAVYIELRPNLENRFLQFGWETVGRKFQVPGWLGEWVPMALRIGEPPVLFEDPSFQRDWFFRTGKKLDVDFWRRINRLTLQIENRSVPVLR